MVSSKKLMTQKNASSQEHEREHRKKKSVVSLAVQQVENFPHF